MKKQYFLAVTAFLLLAAAVNLSSCAKDPGKKETVIDSGTTGDLSWQFTEEGTLHITGKGAMPDYEIVSADWTPEEGLVYVLSTPWDSYRETIKKVIIGEGVTTIGALAFDLCKNLTAITIPKSITTIGRLAFGDCAALTAVILPDNLASIEDNAFAFCTGLAEIILPDGLTKLGGFAFSSTGLTEVVIPASVTDLRAGVFADCTSLTAIKVADGSSLLASEDGVLFNKAKTVLVCYPAGKKETSYTIPAGVSQIFYSAFSGSSLTGIEIPVGVTSIGREAFGACSSLTNVTLPAGITSIGSRTFSNCRSLTGITIPAGITSIGEQAFFSCYSLTDVTCLAVAPPSLDVFNFANNDTDTLSVPAGSLAAYQEDEAWSTAFTTITAIP